MIIGQDITQSKPWNTRWFLSSTQKHSTRDRMTLIDSELWGTDAFKKAQPNAIHHTMDHVGHMTAQDHTALSCLQAGARNIYSQLYILPRHSGGSHTHNGTAFLLEYLCWIWRTFYKFAKTSKFSENSMVWGGTCLRYDHTGRQVPAMSGPHILDDFQQHPADECSRCCQASHRSWQPLFRLLPILPAQPLLQATTVTVSSGQVSWVSDGEAVTGLDSLHSVIFRHYQHSTAQQQHSSQPSLSRGQPKGPVIANTLHALYWHKPTDVMSSNRPAQTMIGTDKAGSLRIRPIQAIFMTDQNKNYSALIQKPQTMLQYGTTQKTFSTLNDLDSVLTWNTTYNFFMQTTTDKAYVKWYDPGNDTST